MLRVINVENVSVKKNGYILLNDLTFEVRMGTFVSIIGGNGSGKSTLIRLLVGLEKYNGFININGYFFDDDSKYDILSGVSVVFDELNSELLGITVKDCLMLGLVGLGKSKVYIDKKINEICQLFKIDKMILNKKIVLLDNALRQRLLIASAVITEPTILLLDDCMHQLSINERNNIISILNKLKKDKKMSIIMVTHDMNDVLKSDRVLVMNNGSIVMDGSVKSVFKQKDKLLNYGLQLPIVVDLSLMLMKRGKISNIYLNERKLVDALWK
ncbi:MAG: ATP-binding cassette domain-containing protein [Bacilli bacterium]|nr:ATP-binding cassette domain-containing protein [Bacilli bacterium]